MALTGKKTDKIQLHAALMGDFHLARDGKELTLPASKKTRALLGYLLMSDRKRSRSDLCDLLWDDIDDPRAALRWSLSKLRTTLGPDFLQADRTHVRLQADSFLIDVFKIEAASKDLAYISIERLISIEKLCRGEFLNGLELPDCYRFYEWCQAERSRFGSFHESILASLVSRMKPTPDKALVFAHRWVSRNPFVEAAHVSVVELLATLGRHADARIQADHCRKVFSVELGVEPSPMLEQALTKVAGSRNGNVIGAIHVPSERNSLSGTRHAVASSENNLIGRDNELQLIETSFAKKSSDIVLIVGEPGIGKSTLLEKVAQSAEAFIVSARCLEAEQSRPFGTWLDALNEIDVLSLPLPAQKRLEQLRSSPRDGMDNGNEQELFETVVSILSEMAKDGSVIVIIDDLQWVEPSSCALLSYATRSLVGQPVHFCFAARMGEIDDNDNVLALLASLSSRLRRIALKGLPHEDALALVRRTSPDAESEAIVKRAQGNPLFLMELARTIDGNAGSKTLQGILDLRIERLSNMAASLLSWVAISGRSASIDILLEVAEIDIADALNALEELERHGLLKASSQIRCEIAHDLIREAAYGRLSNIRRRLMHGKIANRLSLDLTEHPELANEILHHSIVSGQHLLAARTGALAADGALRVYANQEASRLAKQGLIHARQLQAGKEKISLSLHLLGIQLLAASGPFLTRLPDLADDISGEIEKANHNGMAAEVAHGEYLLSVLYQELGDHEASQQATARSADAAQRMETRKKVQQLANSARCLLELGRDVSKAETLITDASSLAEREGFSEIELHWGKGMLAYWKGDLDRAAALLDDALMLARQAEDRWRESKCLIWAATLAMENNQLAIAAERAMELNEIAGIIGEGSTAPLAQAILAMATGNGQDLDAAVEALERADDKSHLAYILNLAAKKQFRAGRPDSALGFLRRAYKHGLDIDNQNEMARAQALAILHGATLDDEKALQSLQSSSKDRPLMVQVQALVDHAFHTLQSSQTGKKNK